MSPQTTAEAFKKQDEGYKAQNTQQENSRGKQEKGTGSRPGLSGVQAGTLRKNGSGPMALGNRASNGPGARHSDAERRAREWKAADEHLARVRDGRGYIDCTNRQKQ